MDFTFSGTGWDPSAIERALKTVCEWVYEESRIKFDISTNELIYFETADKTILDDYSDAEGTYKTRAYSLEESIAEKLQCIIQELQSSTNTINNIKEVDDKGVVNILLNKVY